jgi:S-adenosylmethionine decarboxylase
MIVGQHYLVDFIKVAHPEILDNPEALKVYMQQTIEVSGLQALGEPMLHQFAPHGITCLILLSQSHLAVHTWPEHHFMAVDFFTCGSQEQSDQAYERLKQAIPCQHIIEHKLERQTTL